MKLRNNRGPNWEEARVSVTIVMEKTTPATVMVELAMVASTLRAPSAPPAQIQAVLRAHFTVTAAHEADTEHARTARGKQVPNCVTDGVTLFDLDAETFLARQEQIGFRLRAQNIAPIDDDGVCLNLEDVEGIVDFRSRTGSGDAVHNSACP